jgi:putative PEP-CTERM system TPR-repeat lipoprotein
VIQLRNALQKAPNHPEALYLVGVEYLRAGNFRAAAVILKRSLDQKYDPIKVAPPLCKSWLGLGEFERALEQARIDSGPDLGTRAEFATLRGLALIGLGRFDEGREQLAGALALQPGFPDALLAQARLAAAEGKYDDAAGLLERVIAASPGNADAWMLKGDLERWRKQPGAPATYQKVLELDPENVTARINIASMHVGAGELDAAQEELGRAQKLAPKAPMVKYMEGLIKFRRGDRAAALATAEETLKSNPEHGPSVLLAGVAAFTVAAYPKAQAYLDRSVELAPANLELRKLLALSFARAGDPRRALNLLAAARAMGANDAGTLSLTGEFALQNNDPVMAREFFEKAVQADPASADARTGLAASRLAGGDTAGALTDLEAAVRLDSEKYQADVLLVMSHLQRKQFAQALKAVTVL